MKSKRKTRLVVVKSGEICYKSDKDAEVPKRMLSGSVHLPQGGNNCFGGGQCRALKSPLNNINRIKMWSGISPGESGFHLHTQASEEERWMSLQETKPKVAGASGTAAGCHRGAPLWSPPANVREGTRGTRCTSGNSRPSRQFYNRLSYVSAGEWQPGPGSAWWSPTVLPQHRFSSTACKSPKKCIFLKLHFMHTTKTSSGSAE